MPREFQATVLGLHLGMHGLPHLAQVQHMLHRAVFLLKIQYAFSVSIERVFPNPKAHSPGLRATTQVMHLVLEVLTSDMLNLHI